MNYARVARDIGISDVLETNAAWRDDAWAGVRRLPLGWTGTGEDIRLLLEAEGIVPDHHNAWGGLINGCVREGMLEWTGALAQMATQRSHARATKVYRRVATAKETMTAALRGQRS